MANRIVIASKSEKLISIIRTHVVSAGYEIAAIVADSYELARSVKALSPKIVIIDDEVTGGNLISLVETLTFEQQAVILIGKSFQKSYYQQNPYFEFCEKPIQSNVLLTTLRMLTKYADTVRKLESKVDRLEKKQKTDKKVQEAKKLLQQYENMTEEEAHRYVQQRSMELRISKLEFANRIIKRFEKK